MRMFGCVVMVALFAGAPAFAQEPKIEVGAGVGWARPFHGDLDFTSAAVSGTVRLRLSRLISIEPEIAYWKNTEGETFHAGNASEVIETRSTWTFVSITANAIVHGPAHARARVHGGGGPGIYYGYRRYFQSGTATYPGLDMRRVISPTAGLQVLGGADGRLNNRLLLFGEFRLEIRSFDDPGASVARIMGGVKVPIG